MDADVIIVGAGPAGTTCAREIASRGHSVLVLDRARFPRNKPCGGWVNARAFEDFPELDALRKKSTARRRFVEEALHGLVFLSPELDRRAEHRSRAAVGYTVSRRDFDHRLLELAADQGDAVRFLQRHEAVAVEPGEQSVVVTTDGGQTYESRILVGADGADSSVARCLGLRETWPAERRVDCAHKEVNVDARTLGRRFGKQRRLHVCVGYGGAAGYAWLFPKRNTVNVGVGSRADAGQDPAELFAAWVDALKASDLLPEGLSVGKPRPGMVPAGGAIDFEGHVGKRSLLVGDAGGFVSAASGEGIYPAMLSARVAAGCVVRALGARHPQDALMEFKTAWRKAFAEYIQMPNANLALVMPLVFDNAELCGRLANCYLFGANF